MVDDESRQRTRQYVDVRELHPAYHQLECWNCGAKQWVGPNRHMRICHECFMDNNPTDRDTKNTVEGPDGELYLDYRKLWYGDVSQEEARRRYEENTKDVRENLQRSRARERSVEV